MPDPTAPPSRVNGDRIGLAIALLVLAAVLVGWASTLFDQIGPKASAIMTLCVVGGILTTVGIILVMSLIKKS
jgi:hypothetical protein